MSEIYSVVGTTTYKNLLADPQGADVISVPCTPGKGVIATGTVLYRDDATGFYTAATAADISADKYLVVVKEDVNTVSDVAEDAGAYRAGAFVDGAVVLADGTPVTADQKVVLRGQNIVFDVKA